MNELVSHTELMYRLQKEVTDSKSGVKLIPLTPQYLLANKGMLVSQWEKFFSDSETTKYLHPMTPFKKNKNGQPEQITVSEWLESRAGSHNSVTYIIYHQSTTNPIGHLSLNNIDEVNLTADRGMVIGEPEYRGIGVGRSVGLMSLEIARNAGLTKLTANTDVNNLVSIANLTRQLGNRTLSADGKRYQFSIDLRT